MSNNTYIKSRVQKIRQKMIVFFAFSLFLSGCTTLTVSECQDADWYNVGAIDGSMGAPSDQFSQYVNACGSFYLTPDKEKYKAGYGVGLKAYCTYKNGDALGQKDKLFREVCPAESRGDIARGYRAGKNIFDLDQQIKDQEQQVKKITEKIVNKSTPSKDRVELNEKLKKVTEELVINKEALKKAIEGSPNGFVVDQPMEKLLIDVNNLPKRAMQAGSRSSTTNGVDVQSAPIAPSTTTLPAQ